MLPRGVHVLTADIELLCCLVRQDTTVDDGKYVERTANGVFFNLFLSGQSSGTIFHAGVFYCGIYPLREFKGFFAREPAATGTLPAVTSHHGNSRECTGTSHHGKSSRGNRPPRALATSGIHRICVFVLIKNQYFYMHDT